MSRGTDEGPILFAYDGSVPAQASIREAGRQLTPRRAAIVLTVWQPPAALPFSTAGSGPTELETQMRAEAWSVAREGARRARAAGFAATAQAQSGSPVWRNIVDTADDQDASLVVVGGRSRSGIAKVLLGSVADAVARHSLRPVLIVHTPGAHARGPYVTRLLRADAPPELSSRRGRAGAAAPRRARDRPAAARPRAR
jgi:nucleotide-binding universal stress UspA family protein